MSDAIAAAPVSVPNITAHDLCVALRLAHPVDEYVTVFEVREATGSMHGSRADALVMSLHASRGFELAGFEFKVQRGDWLAELKNPGKADRIARYCDRWCVFAAPGVVKEGELPVGWGLWELHAGTVRRRVVAAALEPEPMPRAFLASFMKARTKLEADDLAALAAHHRREFERQQRVREDASDGDPVLRREREQLREGLRKLEAIREATGIDLADFTPTRRWIERMRLADSPRLTHALHLLHDLFADEELRRRVEAATRRED